MDTCRTPSALQRTATRLIVGVITEHSKYHCERLDLKTQDLLVFVCRQVLAQRTRQRQRTVLNLNLEDHFGLSAFYSRRESL